MTAVPSTSGDRPTAPPGGLEPGLLLRGVIRIFPGELSNVAALRGLDLEIGSGEIAGIVGPSGSGKSTLLRILAGLDRPSSGTVSVLGRALQRATDDELGRYRGDVVGVVEQHYWRAISPYVTAARTIELPLALRGWGRAARRARVAELLERIGLAERASARPAELSGGEQQRVAFATALAHRPRLLLADEPTGELDERTARELLGVLRDLVTQDRATCVVVTHDSLVERVADRVVHVRDGRAVAVRAGGRTASVVDADGWTAPPLPEIPEPPTAVERPDLGDAVVVADRLSRAYGVGGARVLAIDDLTAAFRRGGLHAVTGPSGSGKSTLLRIVAGLDRPTSGSITTLGHDLGGLDADALARLRATSIGYLSQSPRLVPFLSPLENVELALGLRARHLDHDERRERARLALERVGLGHLVDASPETLSGGERARVALARVLAAAPALLVLDEPTASLDRASATALIRLLAELDPAAVTVIAATHDRALIGAASDRLDLRDVRKRSSIPIDALGIAAR